MNLDDARLAPLPGADGLACRFPGVVLFCGARHPAEAVADLIGRCRQAAEAPAPGGPLARQLAGMLAAADPPSVPPFAIAARTSEGVAVLVHGSVDVDVTGEGGDGEEGGDQTLSGATSVTWVDRLLVGKYTALAIHPTGASGEKGAQDVDLIEGVVPANGLRLETRGAGLASGPVEAPAGAIPVAPAAAVPEAEPVVSAQPEVSSQAVEPPPEPPLDPTVGVSLEPPPDPRPSIEDDLPGLDDAVFESVLLPDHEGHDHDNDHDHVEQREPLPVEPDPSEIRAAETGTAPVLVRGVVCSREHFNDPRSRFCSSCGISMVHMTQNLVTGPRPPLGVIVFEDGTTYSLSANYVVGRQPDSSPRVQSGESLPLVLDDSERTISRAHAELRLHDWEVQFVNLSSTNGSFVWEPRNGQWLPVTDQPVVLSPGMRIAFGRRTAVFESALVR